jgi:hypothetical protein
LRFISAPDFESPTDTGGDNSYVLTVTASANGDEVTAQVTVVVVPEEDDIFEPNDGFVTATQIEGGMGRDAKILTGNDDYFKWTSSWFADSGISFNNYDEGNLAIDVYNSEYELIASSDSQNDILIADVDAGQTYFIRIYGIEGAAARYGLYIYMDGPDDRDHDGIADASDPDDDGDGYADVDELSAGTNPLDMGSLPLDTDGDFISNVSDTDDDNDGFSDIEELEMGTDPLNVNDCIICGPKSYWRFKLMMPTL